MRLPPPIPDACLLSSALMLLIACGGDAPGGAGELSPDAGLGTQATQDSGSVHDGGGGEVSACPPGASPIGADAACPERTHCFQVSESLRCQRRNYTLDECVAAGGRAVGDPGDGSVVQGGCPGDRTALGYIDAGWDEGGLCCQLTATDCAGQAVALTGTCASGPPYYSFLGQCFGSEACTCTGPDCDAGFASLEACEAHFAGCAALELRFCGGLAGGHCKEDEFCAYQPLLTCGAFDGSSVCVPRPDSCDDNYDPVCGCNGKTYSNTCVANREGHGIADYGACPD